MAAISKAATFLFLGLASSCGNPSGNGVGVVDGVEGLDHRIFITSTVYNGNLGGISGADVKCQAAASSVGLSKTYKAILSSDSERARERLNLIGAVHAFDTEGEKETIVSLAQDLWSSSLLRAVARDEEGNYAASMVWTGTDSDGGNIGSTIENCGNWTDGSAGDNGAVGDSQRVNGLWLEEPAPDACDELRPIYCISQ